MNTAKKGKVRCIIFKDGNTWYGSALEFNIVIEAESPEVAVFNLNEAVTGYVESFRKIKGSRVSELNQKADKEYENMWDALVNDKPIKSPIQVQSFGYTTV